MKKAARVLLLAAAIAPGLWLPKLFFDDAYITFRYASNIASGGGFCYNPPDRVLGVTTPLFALLLAVSAKIGFPIEEAALALGLAGQALLTLIVYETMITLRVGGGAAGGDADPSLRSPAREAFGPPFLAALACALHPHLVFTAVGGMETSLYCDLLLAALLFAARRRAALAGAAAGLALLTRPDAVIVLPPAAWLLRRSGRSAARGGALIRGALALLAVAGPWLLFATIYFGSPVPHSIEAKRLIHASAPAEVLAEFGRFLRDDPFLIAALPLAAWGAAGAVQRLLRRAGLLRRRQGREDILPRTHHGDEGAPLAVALAAFAAIYLAVYVWSGIAPFPWYVNPLIPPCVVLAVAGAVSLATRASLDRGPVWWGASLAIGGSLLWSVAGQAPALRSDWKEWEGAYEETARFVLRDSRPGDRVYVGEVGVIGYMLPGRTILDSSGINSPEISRIRAGRREEDPEWSREIVRRLDPDYIATSIDYLNIRQLASEEWFQLRFEKVSPPSIEAARQVVFRRRPPR